MSETARREIGVALTDHWTSVRWRSGLDSPVLKMLGTRLALVESDDPDFIVYSTFGQDFRRYRCRRVFYTGENHRPDPRDCDVSLSFAPNSDDNYYLPLYKWRLTDQNVAPPADVDEVIAAKTRFCNFIYGNPRPQERIQFFHELDGRRHVDAAGSLLNNLGTRVPVDHKASFVRTCRFTIAFENEAVPGYTTEKLVDAYLGRSVPIYWGDPGVREIFNPEAIINAADFPSWSSLAAHVVEVDSDPDRYRGYLSQPLFPGGGIPSWLRDDAILDWLVPRVLDRRRPRARTIGGFGRDGLVRGRERALTAARRLRATVRRGDPPAGR